nr:hypothetical protein [Sedimentibacter sp.]
MKKLIFIILTLLLLTSCTEQTDTNIDDPNVSESVTENEQTETKEPQPVKYTGEIIIDGFFSDKGSIYFVPDKETREILKNEYPYTIEAGESIPLNYDDINIIKDLPNELGIYKVKVKANFRSDGISSELKSIELVEEIGTIEYEGKNYPTNELDETVTAKDRVCGLIVSNVRKMNDDGVFIYFEGEIESEGFYSIYPGGEFFNYLNIGRIVPDGESVKNFPTYKGVGVENNFSVYFTETNELYRQLAEHSAIGRGKFKSINYNIVYNYGGGVPPKEILTEIISLDDNYKGMFEFNKNVPVFTLVNEANKYKYGFMDNYAIACVNKQQDNNFTNDYYFLGKDEISKIKILTTDEFHYGLKENETNDDSIFEFETDYNNKNHHTITFRYFNKDENSSGKDIIRKNYNYGYFKIDDETIRVFEKDRILGMTAEDINVEYECTQDSPEQLVKIISKFSGETTITGKLTLYHDEGYDYNRVFFVADEKGIKKLPIHVDDTRSHGGMVFSNENIFELLGSDPFEKNCEITINDYMIHYAETEASNTAELISVNFLE